jgi:hypothetical protein
MKHRFFLLLLIAIGGLSSCKKGFDDAKSDPEALRNTAAGYFLNEILYDGANIGLNRNINLGNELIQVTVSEAETREIHRYIIRTTEYDYSWNNYYPVLNNVKDMRLAAIRDGEKNSEAISLVLWAWIYQNLTDTYGDLPYDDALQGYPNYQLRNKFDKQAYIYQDLINKLDTANSMFNTTTGLEQGEDLLYNAVSTTPANMSYWKKFCNSLRLRLLMRVAAKSAEARAQINMILSNPVKYPVMTAVAESAAVRYSQEEPYVNPYKNARTIDWNGSRAMSKFFIDNLNSWSDPRLAAWCKTILGGGYVGLPSGFTREQQGIASLPYSAFLDALQSSSLTAPIMQYAEVEFIRAEAILKGYFTGTAQTAYENGVKASLGYWGVAVPADFFTRPGIQYDGTLAQLYLQKYYALTFNDMQQWFEIRRTGYPMLPKGDATINKPLPARICYPLIIQSANPVNYQQVVNSMGGDNINTKVWWQQ